MAAPKASHPPLAAGAAGAEVPKAPQPPLVAAGAGAGATSSRSNKPPPTGAAAGDAAGATAGATAGADATDLPLPSPLVGPSLVLSTYIFRSYLALMYFSTTGSAELVGFAPGGRRASQYAFARSLPIVSMSTTCFSFHVSSVVDRTNDMCTPRERWMPEQFVQMKMPRLTDAQRGWREGQSAHSWFSGRFKHASRRLRSLLCSRSDILR